jgi:hypothetical protein
VQALLENRGSCKIIIIIGTRYFNNETKLSPSNNDNEPKNIIDNNTPSISEEMYLRRMVG